MTPTRHPHPSLLRVAEAVEDSLGSAMKSRTQKQRGRDWEMYIVPQVLSFLFELLLPSCVCPLPLPCRRALRDSVCTRQLINILDVLCKQDKYSLTSFEEAYHKSCVAHPP